MGRDTTGKKMTRKNPPPSQNRCPICKKTTEVDTDSFPFCSARCRTIDLGRWADESYKITRPIEQRDLEEGVD